MFSGPLNGHKPTVKQKRLFDTSFIPCTVFLKFLTVIIVVDLVHSPGMEGFAFYEIYLS